VGCWRTPSSLRDEPPPHRLRRIVLRTTEREREHSDAIGVQEERRHHPRRVRAGTPPVLALDGPRSTAHAPGPALTTRGAPAAATSSATAAARTPAPGSRADTLWSPPQEIKSQGSCPSSARDPRQAAGLNRVQPEDGWGARGERPRSPRSRPTRRSARALPARAMPYARS